MSDIAVIGGGASGIVAAITAARLGKTVTIYEKNDRIGKKLLVTGNGRCNLTNINTDLSRYHGSNVTFAENALKELDVQATLNLFEEFGLLTRVEEDGKVYPYCGRAAAVLDVLRLELERLGVEIKCGYDVKDIIKRATAFEIISWQGQHEFCGRVIFATGGKASPNLSSGSGYEILERLGHKITPLSPSIVQLKTDTSAISGLKGVKCEGSLTMCNKTYTGEILFTDYGVSGPPAFSLSSYYNSDCKDISVDFFPDMDENSLYMLLRNKLANLVSSQDLFTGILHKNVANAIFKFSGISADNINLQNLKFIVKAAKKFQLELLGTLSWNNAQVTKGGVSTDNVNSTTMESSLCQGLYITGEILDIDGDCGGFNLQWAWSSGYLAGLMAATAEQI